MNTPDNDDQGHFDIVGKDRELTVAELLLRYLEIEGIRNIFGIPGTAFSYLLYLLRKDEKRFTYHICRHESGASYMADGYARMTGKPGMVFVTSGPGATNALTGAVTAQSCNSPVVVVSGEVPRKFFGKGAFQEGIDATLNIDAVYGNANQESSVVTGAENAQALIAQSLRTAMATPRNACHLSLPGDVAQQIIERDVAVPRSPENYRPVTRCSNLDDARTALKTLIEAERPLLFLGNGCRDALLGRPNGAPNTRAEAPRRYEKFIELVQKFAIPVTTSPNAKGIFPESHELSLRNYGFGGGDWASEYMASHRAHVQERKERFDALVVLGSSLSQKTTESWNQRLIPKGAFVQVDIDQKVVGRSFPVSLGVVAELGAFVDDLITLGNDFHSDPKRVGERRSIVQHIKRNPAAPPSNAVEIEYLEVVNRYLPTGAQLFVDACSSTANSLRYMRIDPPTQIHSAFPMEPMGWAPAVVVGAAIGAPDRLCICICGDGGFMMNGNEVSTAAQYDIGCVWVVHCNNTLAAVELHLQSEFPEQDWMDYYKLGAPNLVDVATGLGADAVQADTIADFELAFENAVKRGKSERKPQVVVFST